MYYIYKFKDKVIFDIELGQDIKYDIGRSIEIPSAKYVNYNNNKVTYSKYIIHDIGYGFHITRNQPEVSTIIYLCTIREYKLKKIIELC